MSQPINGNQVNGNQVAICLEPSSPPSEDERSGLQNDRCKSCLIDRKKVRLRPNRDSFMLTRNSCSVFSRSRMNPVIDVPRTNITALSQRTPNHPSDGSSVDTSAIAVGRRNRK